VKMVVSQLIKDLCIQEKSGVRAEERTVMMSLRYGSPEWEVQHQVGRYLSSQLYQSWCEAGGGALLGWEDVTHRPGLGQVVSLQGKFYLFSPRPGQQIVGRVHSKKADYLEILVLGMFYARINCGVETAALSVKVGQPFLFKVLSVTFNTGRPSLEGELVKGSLKVKEAPVGLFDLAMPLQENGDSEDTSEDSGVESSGNLKRKEAPVSSDKDTKRQKTFSDSPTKDPSTPLRGQKPITAEDLPEGCSIEEKETDKKKWKVYIAPNGKKFTSAKKLRQAIEGGDIKLNLTTSKPAESFGKASGGKTEDALLLLDTFKFVESDWNINDDGSLTGNKNKYYAMDDMHALSKIKGCLAENTEKMKSKEAASTESPTKPPPAPVKAQPPPSQSPVRPQAPPETAVADQTAEVSEKKKKKKKKNKNRDAEEGTTGDELQNTTADEAQNTTADETVGGSADQKEKGQKEEKR